MSRFVNLPKCLIFHCNFATSLIMIFILHNGKHCDQNCGTGGRTNIQPETPSHFPRSNSRSPASLRVSSSTYWVLHTVCRPPKVLPSPRHRFSVTFWICLTSFHDEKDLSLVLESLRCLLYCSFNLQTKGFKTIVIQSKEPASLIHQVSTLCRR